MSFLGFVWLASLLGSFFTPQHLTQPPNKEAPQRSLIPTSIGHILTLVGQHLKPSDSVLRVSAAHSSYTPHGSFLGSSTAFSSQPAVSSSYLLHPDSASSGNFSTFLTVGEDYSPPVQAWFQGFERLIVRAKLIENAAFASADVVSPPVGQDALAFDPGAAISLEQPEEEESGGVLLSGTIAQASTVKASSLQRWTSIADIQVIEANTKSAATAARPSSAKSRQLALLKQCSKWRPSHAAERSRNQAVHQIWVKGRLIGGLPDEAQAYQLANRLRHLLQEQVLRPEALKLGRLKGSPAVRIDNEILFATDELAADLEQQQWLAIKWVDQLRMALGGEPLDLGSIQAFLAGLTESQDQFYGTASWYGPYFHGRQTATGEIFDQNALTAAHKTLPFGTRLKITNRLNERSVVVRINDRGPYIGQRSIDLSRAAARCLGSEGTGVIPYEAVILQPVPETTGAEETLDASNRRRELQARR